MLQLFPEEYTMDDKDQYKKLREFVAVLAARLGLLEEAEFSCCGITLAQCQTLVEIGRAGSLSLGELSDRLNLDNSTLSRTVNNLVEKALCERETNPADRRYVAIKLTQSGIEMFENIECGMNGYYEAIYSAIPEEKRAQVLESMELLLDAVLKSGCMTDCCGK
jgi:DNA-binding MarR family transcriptional regulator